MQPVPARERYASLDVMRGLALFGVLLVNALTLFRVSLFSHILGTDVPAGGPGPVILAAVAALVEFKAFTLFSFLFGVGVALQAQRAAYHGVARFLLRRFLVLLAFGLVHLLLIWNGDILTLYALCGLLLIPLLPLPDAALAMIGVLVITAPQFVALPIHLPDADALRIHADLATRVYAHGTFLQILAFHWNETRFFMGPLLLVTMPKTLGVMLLGVSAWRAGLLLDKPRLWIAVLCLGAVGGVAGFVVPLAMAYAAAILLWCSKAPLVAAAGQMAFTNYLAQSVVCSLVFYGFGFGLFGKVSVPATVIGVVPFYGLQLLFSRWWLQRFPFGPMEWVWRSFTYGRTLNYFLPIS